MRRHLRSINGFALVAMLWLAALPTLSQALARAAGQASWVEVCTPQGLRLQALGDAAAGSAEMPADPGSQSATAGHCPLCSLGSSALGPPHPSAVPVPAPGGDSHRAHDRRLPVAEAPWRGMQPRAPPASA